MIGFRYVLIGLGALLGVLLVAQGAVLIGAVLLVMAAVRLAMVLRFRSLRGERLARREELRERMRARRGF